MARAAAVCQRKLSGNLRSAVAIGFSLAVFALLGLGLTLPGLVHAAASKPILVVGDSLSAGYGVKVDATWVALLEQRLAKQGYGYRVVNASISGETTGGARSRLPRALELHKPAVVIIELGGNDGLRGLPLKQVRSNFEYLIETSQATQAKVVLVGMRMPPNYGAEYANSFHALYGELAKKYDVPLVDFFLDGVALDDTLMQADGIHPNATAQPKLLDNLWPALNKVLTK
ncbi:arylesterase [Steroidobacter agaridevorans]|uniref:Arylesterase n=1 Tax=Steroidobacter agaridevorans TaxID=2695856 RepID=A0A829Y5H5_9GAMM|nr:arylesterase [Steroidobacter agaridevorans]GFE78265.1 arylesterase [Steroidobacter agaridevorans]